MRIVCLNQMRWKNIRAGFFFFLVFMVISNILHNSINAAWETSLPVVQSSDINDWSGRGQRDLKMVSHTILVNLVIRLKGLPLIPAVPVLRYRNVHLQTVNYIMSEAMYWRNQEKMELIKESANVTLTNFEDDHDYLSFLLGIYYKSDVAIVLTVTEEDDASVLSEVDRWIDHSLQQYLANPDLCLVSSNQRFMSVSNILLRRFLMYSTFRFSSRSPYRLLATLVDARPSRSFSQSIRNDTYNDTRYRKCMSVHTDRNSTFSVFLRLYRRRYLRKQLLGIFSQTLLPQSVFIIQNRNLTDFDYSRILRDFGEKSEIRFIWNTNWNAFFHLSYLLSGFSESPLSFTYDDDQILSAVDTHAKAVAALSQQPGIYSLRPWCWCKRYRRHARVMQCARWCRSSPDLVVNPFFAHSWIGKLMWRFDIPTYFCCEEMSYLLSARIECGVRWFLLNSTYRSYQKDSESRNQDQYTQQLMKTVDWDNLEHVAMSYYIRAGYRPNHAYDPKYLSMKQNIFPISCVCCYYSFFVFPC